jgi:3D (Asp-Asp-Asp) domain-containing protein
MNPRYNGKNRVDVWMNETTEAIHFGVQEAYAVILD